MNTAIVSRPVSVRSVVTVATVGAHVRLPV